MEFSADTTFMLFLHIFWSLKAPVPITVVWVSTVFLSVINAFIQQGRFKMIEYDSKDISNVTKDFVFQINAFFFFYFLLKESWEIRIIVLTSKIILKKLLGTKSAH